MSLALKEYDIHSSFHKVPEDLRPYYFNERLVPNEKDFYSEFSKIQSVSIRIFRDRFLRFRSSDDPDSAKYHVQQSDVIITTRQEVVKVGLQLFPIMRFKRPDLPEISIYIENINGEKISIQLPPTISSNLLKFLNEGRPNLDFTCYQFVDFLKDLYGVRAKMSDKYRFEPFDVNELSPGDAILLRDKEAKPLHMALYLAEDLYLWHSGSACLRVSSLEEMKICYGAGSVEIAISYPRDLWS